MPRRQKLQCDVAGLIELKRHGQRRVWELREWPLVVREFGGVEERRDGVLRRPIAGQRALIDVQGGGKRIPFRRPGVNERADPEGVGSLEPRLQRCQVGLPVGAVCPGGHRLRAVRLCPFVLAEMSHAKWRDEPHQFQRRRPESFLRDAREPRGVCVSASQHAIEPKTSSLASHREQGATLVPRVASRLDRHAKSHVASPRSGWDDDGFHQDPASVKSVRPVGQSDGIVGDVWRESHGGFLPK